MTNLQDTIGAGVDAALNLNLSDFQSNLQELKNSLQESGDAAMGKISNAVSHLKESGLDKLKAAADKAGGQGEVWGAYNNIVTELRHAAKRGVAQAKDLLDQLGEKACGCMH